MTNTLEATTQIITSNELLDHWIGHRRLTRRTIEAFPEKELFTYSVGGMRPFAEMVLECVGMTIPGIIGVKTGEWNTIDELMHHSKKGTPTTKEELLNLVDEVTEQMTELWTEIPEERFREKDRAFGQWEGTNYWFVLYWIDNEIHHRAQAFVYLRSLGIQPPFFWER